MPPIFCTISGNYIKVRLSQMENQLEKNINTKQACHTLKNEILEKLYKHIAVCYCDKSSKNIRKKSCEALWDDIGEFMEKNYAKESSQLSEILDFANAGSHDGKEPSLKETKDRINQLKTIINHFATYHH